MKKRVEFIDLLRGWAVIVMIETHVVNATIQPSLTVESFGFDLLKFFNGLVAPSFLFASGLAYAVTTRRKVNDYLAFGAPLFKQVMRLLLILVIGYSLHIPKFNYEHLLKEAGAEAWQKFWQVDVLQCIAVSLLFLQAMLLVLRSEKLLYRVISALTVLILAATPLMWGKDFWDVLPVPVAAYLNGLHFSLFPIFPWSAFLFTGAIAGHYYNRAKEGEFGGEEPLMKRYGVMALAAVAASFALRPLETAVYPVYDYWKFGSAFVVLRLGIVMALCTAMFLYEKTRGVSPRSPVTLVGRESLVVYTTHLLLIYGNFSTFNFQRTVNSRFNFFESALATLILLGAMYGLALGWSAVKRTSRRVQLASEFVLVIFLVGLFFFGPGK